jgi:hypothetical protein
MAGLPPGPIKDINRNRHKQIERAKFMVQILPVGWDYSEPKRFWQLLSRDYFHPNMDGKNWP